VSSAGASGASAGMVVSFSGGRYAAVASLQPSILCSSSDQYANIIAHRSFSPTRPVVTFDNKKVVGKALWHAEMAGKNGVDRKREQSLFRETERRAESTAKDLKRLYKKNREEFKKGVLETKNQEANVMQDLKDLEKNMLKSDKTDFANKLVEGRFEPDSTK